jgi:hypothetical protein
LTCDFWAENAEKKCKGRNNGKNKGDIQSLHPAGFAPAFGRAVGRFAAGLRRWAEAQLYLRGNSKSNLRSNSKSNGSMAWGWLTSYPSSPH